MTIGGEDDLRALRRVGAIVAETLAAMEAAVRPGVTTAELDAIAEAIFRRHGARSAPQLAYNFPGQTCISVNDQIVHGVPGSRKIGPRDVLKLDVTAELDGYVADAAITVLVPPVQPEGRRLRKCVEQAFQRALAVMRPGVAIAEVGRAVENEAKRQGCAILRELVGHGVGRTVHEEPSVPNYYSPLTHGVLAEGMVLAVEPIVASRPARIVEERDGWTLRTHNYALAAHYEHTLVITAQGAEVLTARAA